MTPVADMAPFSCKVGVVMVTELVALMTRVSPVMVTAGASSVIAAGDLLIADVCAIGGREADVVAARL